MSDSKDDEIAELKARLARLEGAPQQTPPAPKKKGGIGCLGVAGIVFIGFVIVGAIASNGQNDTSTQSSDQTASSAALASPAIDLSDAKALDDKYEIKATASCDTYSGDYIRKVAKYDYKWDDSTKGFFGTKFDKYRRAVASPGVLTLVSDKLMLQNGFGAYTRMVIECRYDTQADKIVGYEIEQ